MAGGRDFGAGRKDRLRAAMTKAGILEDTQRDGKKIKGRAAHSEGGQLKFN